MSSETVKHQQGEDTFRIQFEIVAPPPVIPVRAGEIKKYAPKPQFKVASIRVTEIGDLVGDNGRKKVVNFDRGFDTLAQARNGATEYAKRVIREKMGPPKAAAAVEAAPAAEVSAAPEPGPADGGAPSA
jgi:hypothetical protein